MSKGKKVEEIPSIEVNEPEIVTGSGVFLYPNGSQYDGEWKSVNGVKFRHGVGTFNSGPEKYQGEWENDLMNGEGVYHFSSGSCYTGFFVKNAFEGLQIVEEVPRLTNPVLLGHGLYSFPDGAKYEGSWLGGKMHGEGEYKDADGVSWKGNFFNGMYDSGRSYLSLRPAKGLV